MDYETWYHAYHDNGMYHGPKYSSYVQADENGDLWSYHTKWGDVEDWTPALVGPALSTGDFFPQKGISDCVEGIDERLMF